MRPAQASEGPVTVFIYVNTSKQVGVADHLKVFANAYAAETCCVAQATLSLFLGRNRLFNFTDRASAE
jgi:hypothetical protein